MNRITHNWSEYVTFASGTTAYPTTTAEVREVLRGASKIRTIGSRHSFNDIADTDGTMISLRSLARRVEIDGAARTATVDGGITYSQLGPALDAAGWALTNLASAPDFTVVGAAATATHGSGTKSQNLAAAIRALEIVTAAGDLVQLKRGDRDFDGAVVGLGALGVVTSLTLDIVPRYELRQDIFHRLPFDAVVEAFDELMASAYSVSLFTHWTGDFVDQGWLKSVPEAAPPATFFGGVPAQRLSGPLMGTEPVTITEQMGIPGAWYDRLPHFKIGGVAAVGGEFQAEYFVSRANAKPALRAIKAIQGELHPALMVSEVRVVKADPFWLSMNYEMDSVGLHFTMHRDREAVRKALVAVEAALAPFKPRPHWGKLFLMPAAEVMAGYPRLGDFRELATRLDPQGKFRNGFIDRYVFGA